MKYRYLFQLPWYMHNGINILIPITLIYTQWNKYTYSNYLDRHIAENKMYVYIRYDTCCNYLPVLSLLCQHSIMQFDYSMLTMANYLVSWIITLGEWGLSLNCPMGGFAVGQRILQLLFGTLGGWDCNLNSPGVHTLVSVDLLFCIYIFLIA